MRFLLSNDDGYLSPGLAVLAQAASGFGEVQVIAPERDRSGASNSLTLDRPLFVRCGENGFHYVNGTPSDCIHLALTGVFEHRPDLILSGVNHGANMGDDTIYSGTVAAAMEGYLLGIPSVAFSLTGKPPLHLETAKWVVKEILERLTQSLPAPSFLMNINIPDVPLGEIEGFAVTRLGKRHAAESVVALTSPWGERAYWIGLAGEAADAGEGTDFHAVARCLVSVTPLRADLTQPEMATGLRTWLLGQ